jgi:hypothetical protein
MATLLLTAAGTALAGPIGGAIGAIVGQAADQAVFGPKARRGPRPGDLSVQTSSYGSDIPKLFGRMRVAGTVIWATDLVERRSSTGGGKGRPGTVSYSYFANFAVALSARRVRAVHRIWADGKLLRGASGDLKSQAAIRFHDGDEDQAADPLIVSALGPGTAPAFRGTAYIVFEALELADFGNRIPSLTFEVEADPAAVAIGDIAAELAAGIIAAGPTPQLGGYAASGDSLRSALGPLIETASLSLAAEGDRLWIASAPGPPDEIGSADFAAPVEVTRRAAAAVPGEVTLSYYDDARDYQTGSQRARRGGGSERSEARSLAAVLAAPEAKIFAEARLAALWIGRTSAKLRLPVRRAGIRPGGLVRIEGEPGQWKVRRWLLERMEVALELIRVPQAAAIKQLAAAGSAVRAPDLIHGPTTIRLLELPLPGPSDGPSLAVLAGGVEPGWRRATILFSADDRLTWRDGVRTAQPAVLGTATGPLQAGGSALVDARSTVDVALLNDTLWLEGCSDAELAGGANLALLGAELIQFGCAEPLGGGRFRLSRLLRGRRGTEAAASSHNAGEAFSLLEPEAMLPIPVPRAAVGARAVALAAGIGDVPEGVEAELVVTGESMRPPSPVHLRAEERADGALVVSWVRRSRSGWSWTSGSDAPLGEEQELYVVTLTSGAVSRSFERDEAQLVYSAADRQADAIAFPVAIVATQIGTFAASPPASLTFG